MSGGVLNYSYWQAQDTGVEIKLRAGDNPTLKSFGNFMINIAEALKDVDRYLSGDESLEVAEQSIKKAMGDEWKKYEIEFLKSEAERIIQQLTKLIEK